MIFENPVRFLSQCPKFVLPETPAWSRSDWAELRTQLATQESETRNSIFLMRLNNGLHLAYCTNVHPGESWAETLDSLKRWTLPVKAQVCPNGPYAIGLRLSDRASRDLSEPRTLLAFQRWLDRHNCYVFTINGFPFGRFHGARVKESVYRPDWTDPKRLEYTQRLFQLLALLLPAQVEGSVSTMPGSFKEFIRTPEQAQLVRSNVWHCVEHVAKTCADTGCRLHLGLEPEPLGLLETSAETIRFFEELRAEHPGDSRLEEHLGVNYDTCHFAVEFEEPQPALESFRRHRIRLSKIHLSNALSLRPTRPRSNGWRPSPRMFTSTR